MTSPDPAFAAWLQQQSRLSSAEDAGAAAFGDDAGETTILSPYALEADATAEAGRQLAFLAEPHVAETVEYAGVGVVKSWRGKCITITSPWPGYEGGALCFVLGGDEDHATGITQLHVLRRLT